MFKVIDLTGQRFGKLTVLEKSTLNNGHTNANWRCRCDCGNEKIARAASLRSGATRSCGCLLSDGRKRAAEKLVGEKSHFYKHGMSKSRINGIYRKIKGRCNNPNNPAYHRYGGRGIKMCDEWANDFVVFYEWAMRNGYTEQMTIDRIDNDGDYAPDNCRWVTLEVQQNNRSNNVVIEYDGQAHTLSEWADIIGMSKKSLYHRYERKWPIAKMLGQASGR